jgi:hypothetical protein
LTGFSLIFNTFPSSNKTKRLSSPSLTVNRSGKHRRKRMNLHLLHISGAVAGHPKVAAPPPENFQTHPFSKIFISTRSSPSPLFIFKVKICKKATDHSRSTLLSSKEYCKPWTNAKHAQQRKKGNPGTLFRSEKLMKIVRRTSNTCFELFLLASSRIWACKVLTRFAALTLVVCHLKQLEYSFFNSICSAPRSSSWFCLRFHSGLASIPFRHRRCLRRIFEIVMCLWTNLQNVVWLLWRKRDENG